MRFVRKSKLTNQKQTRKIFFNFRVALNFPHIPETINIENILKIENDS